MQDVVVDAVIGYDFKRIVNPFVRTIHLPPDISLHLSSSGNSRKIDADTKVVTTWGDVKATGNIVKQVNYMNVDINLTGDKFDHGQWMSLPIPGRQPGRAAKF